MEFRTSHFLCTMVFPEVIKEKNVFWNNCGELTKFKPDRQHSFVCAAATVRCNKINHLQGKGQLLYIVIIV